MITRSLLVAFAATAALAVAACGGGGNDPTSSTSRNAAMKKALLNYAKCMREHGVDMPDPQFDSGGGKVTMTQKAPPDPAKGRAAEQACKHFQDEVKPATASEAEKAEMRKRALANSKCMREHGFPNFPDPVFDENGGAGLKFSKGSGMDPNNPRFKAAMETCAKQSGMDEARKDRSEQ